MSKISINLREKLIYAVEYLGLIVIWLIVFLYKFNISYYKEYYIIPITMVFGSFIGGATCEGGGAVAFPVFTKILHISPFVTRDFSFAIQSIGMSFASITILLRKVPIEKNIIKYATTGGIIGIIIGSYKLVPIISPQNARLIFTAVITAFGISLYTKNFVMKSATRSCIENLKAKDKTTLLLIGFLGGLFSSIIGTGIHFITFSVVTLLYRLDEKVATPTSVIIMACDSIFGFIFRGMIIGGFSEEAIIYWMLCIPIVAFFAPLGARISAKVSRMYIVKFLLFLIGVEFISTIMIFKVRSINTLILIIFLFICLTVYFFIIKLSSKYISIDEVKRL